MPDNTTEQAMQMGVDHHNAGRLVEAERLYRHVLAIDPRDPDALHLLGVIAYQSGHTDDAIQLMRKALTVRPRDANFLNNLAAALIQRRDTTQAVECLRQAIKLAPDHASARLKLGVLLEEQGQLDEALVNYERAIAADPNVPQAHRKRGNVLVRKKRFAEAEASLRRALAMKADDAQAMNNLGAALLGQDRKEEALAAFRAALEIDPKYPPALFNVGRTLAMAGKPDEAIVAIERLIAVAPDHPYAFNSLGSAYQDRGDLDAAIACFRRAQQRSPDVHHDSNIVYVMHFHPGFDAAAILAAHREWAERNAKHLISAIRPHDNDRAPTRRLRIGYVSPDFREHSVGRFLLPLMEHHDHTNFEIVCFSNVVMHDATTDRFNACADRWHDTAELNDEALAELIRRERIDVLIDLSLHMAGNRMLVFARKPAPVQVTYLAYASTSGLATMDYRLTDPHIDPPGEDANYVERSVRLRSYWCYQPMDLPVEVGPLPAMSDADRRVTFGSLNNFMKVSRGALETWKKLLDAVEGSRLLISAPQGIARERVAAMLGEDRVEFVDRMKFEPYFQTYNRIDIALDTFPYGGGTTTCDALWMGAPVVTPKGKTAVGRGGVSLLHPLGMQDLVAADENEYVKIAADLAADLPRLAEMRKGLRQRMLSSPLCDAQAFARDVEDKFRWMWQQWCRSVGGD